MKNNNNNNKKVTHTNKRFNKHKHISNGQYSYYGTKGKNKTKLCKTTLFFWIFLSRKTVKPYLEVRSTTFASNPSNTHTHTITRTNQIQLALFCLVSSNVGRLVREWYGKLEDSFGPREENQYESGMYANK